MAMQHSRYNRPRRHWGFTLFIILTETFVAIAIVWTLASLRFLPSVWAVILSVTCAVLGPLLALFQIMQPLLSRPLQTEPPDLRVSASIYGTICVWVDTFLHDITVYICKGFHEGKPPGRETAAIASERTINGRTGVAALFEFLEPGNYTIFDEGGRFKQEVTLRPGEIVQIDRTKRRRARQSSIY